MRVEKELRSPIWACIHAISKQESAKLFRLYANTDPQHDSIFTKGLADVLEHATSEITIGSKLGIDATKKLPGEGAPGRRSLRWMKA